MAAIQGDWYIGHSDSESYPVKDQMRCVFADQTDGDRFMVAKVWGDLDGDYESTARLIAAAPKMLAALKEAEQALEYFFSRFPVGTFGSRLGVVRDAIAQAEGGDAKVVESAPQCCICGGPIPKVNRWRAGHNAQPVADGRCCGVCNGSVVIPARLAEFASRKRGE